MRFVWTLTLSCGCRIPGRGSVTEKDAVRDLVFQDAHCSKHGAVTYARFTGRGA